MIKMKKYLIAIFLLIPMIVTANDNPKVMYDFIPYLGARAPDWIMNINKRESESNKVIKTIVYEEMTSLNVYTFTLFDDIVYSVEVRIGKIGKEPWTVEDKYKKLGIASGLADSLQANGFTMTVNKNDSKVRYFEKGDVVISLDNYQTQYKKDSNDPAILLTFINNKFTQQVIKRRPDIISRLSIEHKDAYKDLIGK